MSRWHDHVKCNESGDHVSPTRPRKETPPVALEFPFWMRAVVNYKLQIWHKHLGSVHIKIAMQAMQKKVNLLSRLMKFFFYFQIIDQDF